MKISVDARGIGGLVKRKSGLTAIMVFPMLIYGCASNCDCDGQSELADCNDQTAHIIDSYDGPTGPGHDADRYDGKYDGPTGPGHDHAPGSDFYQCTVRNQQLISGLVNCRSEYAECLEVPDADQDQCPTEYQACYEAVVTGGNSE